MAASFGRTVINPAALAELLRSADGPVYRHMIELGEQVKMRAIAECPVSEPAPVSIPYRNPKPPPGQLKASIVKRIVEDPSGLAVLVGSSLPYAMFVHEGTQTHDIPAKARALVFWWKRSGRVEFRSPPYVVSHPGTQPNRFLVRALEALGVR